MCCKYNNLLTHLSTTASNVILIVGILVCIVVRLSIALPSAPWSCVLYFSTCGYFEKLESEESEWICSMVAKEVPHVGCKLGFCQNSPQWGGGGAFSAQLSGRINLSMHGFCGWRLFYLYASMSSGGGGVRQIRSKLRFFLLKATKD